MHARICLNLEQPGFLGLLIMIFRTFEGPVVAFEATDATAP